MKLRGCDIRHIIIQVLKSIKLGHKQCQSDSENANTISMEGKKNALKGWEMSVARNAVGGRI